MSIKKIVLNKMKEKKITRTRLASDVHIATRSLTLWLEGRKELPYNILWSMFERLELNVNDLKRFW